MRHIGFTLIELLIVVVILGLLVAISIPVLIGAKKHSREVVCGMNLNNIFTAFHMYAGQNDGCLPDDESEKDWNELLDSYVSGQAIFTCPSDLEGLTLEDNISYTWRESFEVDNPEAALSGRQLSEITQPELIMIFDEFPDWHKKNHMNAITIDSAVSLYLSDDLEENLLTPIK